MGKYGYLLAPIAMTSISIVSEYAFEIQGSVSRVGS